jgi:hypothetical protein
MSSIPFHEGVANLSKLNSLATNDTNSEANLSVINSDDGLFTEAELKLLGNIPSLNKEKKITDSASDKLFQYLKIINNKRDWVEPLIQLLKASNESPIQCAEKMGVAWCTVLGTNKAMKEQGDTSLEDAIKLSKMAFAENIMFHPEKYAGNSQMATFLVKSQAGWRDQENLNEFGTPTSQELENIMQARSALLEEREKLEQAYHLGTKRDEPKILTA